MGSRASPVHPTIPSTMVIETVQGCYWCCRLPLGAGHTHDAVKQGDGAQFRFQPPRWSTATVPALAQPSYGRECLAWTVVIKGLVLTRNLQLLAESLWVKITHTRPLPETPTLPAGLLPVIDGPGWGPPSNRFRTRRPEYLVCDWAMRLKLSRLSRPGSSEA